MKNCKIIAISNQKGGTGKTTTTYNLGMSLAEQGMRVLLVDNDPQSDLSTLFGIPDADDLDLTIHELYTMMMEEVPLPAPEKFILYGDLMDIIPSSHNLCYRGYLEAGWAHHKA